MTVPRVRALNAERARWAEDGITDYAISRGRLHPGDQPLSRDTVAELAAGLVSDLVHLALEHDGLELVVEILCVGIGQAADDCRQAEDGGDELDHAHAEMLDRIRSGIEYADQ